MNDLTLSFGAVAVLMLAEFILAWRWNAFYYSAGLPVFWRRVDRPNGLGDVDLEELQKRCATAAGAPVQFHRIGPDLIAFREKPFGGLIHYTPIMRGVIRHRREESSVLVLGLVKWWVVALIALCAWYLRAKIIDIVPYLGGALAVLYLIQSVRFARVAKALRGPLVPLPQA